MSEKWSISDELMRLAEGYLQNPAKLVNDMSNLDIKRALREGLEQGVRDGFADYVDDPRAAAPSSSGPKETPMAKNSLTSSVHLFTCPACKQDVNGTATVDLEATNISEDLHSPAELTFKGSLSGLHVLHDCRPRVTR